MCGIAGLICNEERADAAQRVTAMTQTLVHRGPDDGGVAAFANGGHVVVERKLGRPNDAVDWGATRCSLAIGARRLAILDRSAHGAQPMAAPDGQAWIVFNGEIYNYVELRGELAARGMTFAGASDTEVALAAYRAWGPACFAGFRGMWAIAIVDWVAGRIVLSRDRLGIKPLYLAATSDGYAFASEIKALLSQPGVTRDVHEARLRDFLIEGLIDHTSDTLFEGVWALEPGCRLEIDLRPPSLNAQLGQMRRDWPLAAPHPAPSAPEEFVSHFDDALRVHLRSDVPIGSCLSGGLDSSAVVASLHAMKPGLGESSWSQHTFSAVLPGDTLDESRYVDAVLAACPGLNAHRIEPSPQRLLNDMDRLIWHQDEPFASPSIFMQWEVMRQAREQGVTVLLDGQGGDELFCGYPGYAPAYIASLWRRMRIIGGMREWLAAPMRGHFSRIGLLAHTSGHLLPGALRRSMRRARDARRATYLDPELLDAPEPTWRPFELRVPRGIDPPRTAMPPGMRGFDRFCWDLLLSASLPALLHYEDRNSMAHSIEARVPWLDAPLVDYAMGLPTSAKLDGGRLKVLPRLALRGRVPEAILLREDKIGFAAPTAAWMAGPLRTWWRDLIASQSFRERGCFHLPGVERLARQFDDGDGRAALPLWRLAIAEQWARRMLDVRS